VHRYKQNKELLATLRPSILPGQGLGIILGDGYPICRRLLSEGLGEAAFPEEAVPEGARYTPGAIRKSAKFLITLCWDSHGETRSPGFS